MSDPQMPKPYYTTGFWGRYCHEPSDRSPVNPSLLPWFWRCLLQLLMNAFRHIFKMAGRWQNCEPKSPQQQKHLLCSEFRSSQRAILGQKQLVLPSQNNKTKSLLIFAKGPHCGTLVSPFFPATNRSHPGGHGHVCPEKSQRKDPKLDSIIGLI